jgi:N-acetylglucosaminyl-diphospho-decaprenol L-rhamnosyltransferase
MVADTRERHSAAVASDVAAIIVNYNSSTDVASCVEWLKSTHPTVTIIVVDNASARDDFETLHSLDQIDHLICLPKNGGYASGINRGLLKASELLRSWAWLINPDARPDDEALDALLSYTDRSVALGTRQEQSADPAVPGTPYLTAANIVAGRVRGVLCPGCEIGSHEVDVVTGACLLVPTELALQVGGMDESYFHYKEEFDFVEQLGNHGVVRLVCEARVWHRRGGSLDVLSAAAAYYRARNEVLYLRKRHRRWRWKAVRSPRLMYEATCSLAKAVFPGAAQATARGHVLGLWDGICGATGPTTRNLAGQK